MPAFKQQGPERIGRVYGAVRVADGPLAAFFRRSKHHEFPDHTNTYASLTHGSPPFHRTDPLGWRGDAGGLLQGTRTPFRDQRRFHGPSSSPCHDPRGQPCRFPHASASTTTPGCSAKCAGGTRRRRANCGLSAPGE